LPDHQFCFRMAHSTSHQLRRVVRHVKGRREPPLSESTSMLLLDVEKAFDSVWHEALLLKLLARGCNLSLTRLIFSFQICVGKSQSLSCNIRYSVPQGAILSPTLYNIFTSDIPNEGECGRFFRANFRNWFAANCRASLTLFLITSRIGRFESIIQKLKRSFLQTF
jgi:hypothetical protein